MIVAAVTIPLQRHQQSKILVNFIYSIFAEMMCIDTPFFCATGDCDCNFFCLIYLLGPGVGVLIVLIIVLRKRIYELMFKSTATVKNFLVQKSPGGGEKSHF